MGARINSFTTPMQGLIRLELQPVNDVRGSFTRLFCQDDLSDFLNGRMIAQINHAHSIHAGCVRGLHYQNPPYAEIKIVKCIRGKIFDVAVDLRAGSTTFLKWFGLELAGHDHTMLLIPEGFAHGYQALEPDSEIIYLNTMAYTPASEGAVHYADPAIDIQWPLPVRDLSERDATHPFLTSQFSGLNL